MAFAVRDHGRTERRLRRPDMSCSNLSCILCCLILAHIVITYQYYTILYKLYSAIIHYIF